MTREVKIGSNRFTKVISVDEPGDGGAYHEYRIVNNFITRLDNPTEPGPKFPVNFGLIQFQKGPVKESGVNGCHQEDLIAIVIDRLQCFQAGDFACRENALALTKLEEALHWLNHRTKDRIDRGVEGTSVI